VNCSRCGCNNVRYVLWSKGSLEKRCEDCEDILEEAFVMNYMCEEIFQILKHGIPMKEDRCEYSLTEATEVAKFLKEANKDVDLEYRRKCEG
jgi:hypothetical protein